MFSLPVFSILFTAVAATATDLSSYVQASSRVYRPKNALEGNVIRGLLIAGRQSGCPIGCSDGGCCASGQFCVTGGCCDDTWTNCFDGSCCLPGSFCVTGGCCPDGEVCAGGGGTMTLPNGGGSGSTSTKAPTPKSTPVNTPKSTPVSTPKSTPISTPSTTVQPITPSSVDSSVPTFNTGGGGGASTPPSNPTTPTTAPSPIIVPTQGPSNPITNNQSRAARGIPLFTQSSTALALSAVFAIFFGYYI
ncbi:hypothetical protein K439DRAFT_1637570 [Ramaria rubella]|nr:hypothetical protein K439DRAFT_1637570 [Ramaria rubella]